MKKVELVPRLFRKDYVDYYGIAQMYYFDDKIDLVDCGTLTAQIIKIEDDKPWVLKMRVLHPTPLELDLIKEFAWQNGIRDIKVSMAPAEMRKKYGDYERRI